MFLLVIRIDRNSKGLRNFVKYIQQDKRLSRPHSSVRTGSSTYLESEEQSCLRASLAAGAHGYRT